MANGTQPVTQVTPEISGGLAAMLRDQAKTAVKRPAAGGGTGDLGGRSTTVASKRMCPQVRTGTSQGPNEEVGLCQFFGDPRGLDHEPGEEPGARQLTHRENIIGRSRPTAGYRVTAAKTSGL